MAQHIQSETKRHESELEGLEDECERRHQIGTERAASVSILQTELGVCDNEHAELWERAAQLRHQVSERVHASGNDIHARGYIACYAKPADPLELCGHVAVLR